MTGRKEGGIETRRDDKKGRRRKRERMEGREKKIGN